MPLILLASSHLLSISDGDTPEVKMGVRLLRGGLRSSKLASWDTNTKDLTPSLDPSGGQHRARKCEVAAGLCPQSTQDGP